MTTILADMPQSLCQGWRSSAHPRFATLFSRLGLFEIVKRTVLAVSLFTSMEKNYWAGALPRREVIAMRAAVLRRLVMEVMGAESLLAGSAAEHQNPCEKESRKL